MVIENNLFMNSIYAANEEYFNRLQKLISIYVIRCKKVMAQKNKNRFWRKIFDSVAIERI